MNSQSIEIKQLPVEGKENTFYVVSVNYHKGGMSYYDYKVKPRRYALHVSEQKIEHTGGRTARSFMLFSGGIQKTLEEAKAFSAKRLAKLAEAITEADYLPLIDAIKAEAVEIALRRGR
jgi:hypothetical protein